MLYLRKPLFTIVMHAKVINIFLRYKLRFHKPSTEENERRKKEATKPVEMLSEVKFGAITSFEKTFIVNCLRTIRE